MGNPAIGALKRRAFVSSVMAGFKEMREAARRGILASGLEPVLVEDFPSVYASPRNACLDGVDSCDVFIAIVGERGGFRTPSGRLVVEEELEQARKSALPILVFLQDTPRDSDAKLFEDRLSNYVGGYFRSTFRTAVDLEDQVRAATARYGGEMGDSIGGEAIIDDLRETRIRDQEPSIRFVLAPERTGEVIELVRLEDQGFQDDVYRLAHDRSVGLFSYEAPKQRKSTEHGLLFSQSHGVGVAKGAPDVEVEVRTDGRLLIDREVYRPNELGFGGGLVIVEADVARCLSSCFAFADRFYGLTDPYLEHTSFWLGISLANSGFRAMVKDPAKDGMQIRMRGQERSPILVEDPRRIARDVLASSDAAIERALTYLRRRLGE